MEIKYALNGKYQQYGNIFKIVKLGTAITFIMFLLCLIGGIIAENNIGVILVVASVIIFAFFIAFAVAFKYYASIIKDVGLYEALDIQDNKIIYMCEKKGLKVVSPENIKAIKILAERHGIYTIRVYAKEPGEPFDIPDSFANHQEIINKFRKFAEENKILIIK